MSPISSTSTYQFKGAKDPYKIDKNNTLSDIALKLKNKNGLKQSLNEIINTIAVNNKIITADELKEYNDKNTSPERRIAIQKKLNTIITGNTLNLKESLEQLQKGESPPATTADPKADPNATGSTDSESQKAAEALQPAVEDVNKGEKELDEGQKKTFQENLQKAGQDQLPALKKMLEQRIMKIYQLNQAEQQKAEAYKNAGQQYTPKIVEYSNDFIFTSLKTRIEALEKEQQSRTTEIT